MSLEFETPSNIIPLPTKPVREVKLQDVPADIIDFQEAKDARDSMLGVSETSKLFVIFEKVKKLYVYTTFFPGERYGDTPLDTA